MPPVEPGWWQGIRACTNANNGSRICTLIKAATQFVNTLTSAISSAQQLYISVVPYVTTVNVGNALCTSATSCSGIATTGGDFTDLRGNIMPVIPIIGSTSNASSTISSVSMLTPGGSVSGTAAIQSGMSIYGPGIPAGATVSSVSGSSITISSTPSLTYTGNSLAVGPLSGNTNTTGVGYTDPTTFSTTGSWTNGSKTLTVASASGIVAGMVVTSASSGIPTATATTVSSIVGTTVTLSANATATQANKSVTFSLAGSATSGSKTISSLKGTNTSLNSIVVGMGISGSGIPNYAYVTGTTGNPPTSLTISAAVTATKAGDIVTLTNFGGTTANGSTTVSNVYFSTVPTVGNVIVGNGIPVNTTITAAPSTAAQYRGRHRAR